MYCFSKQHSCVSYHFCLNALGWKEFLSFRLPLDPDREAHSGLLQFSSFRRLFITFSPKSVSFNRSSYPTHRHGEWPCALTILAWHCSGSTQWVRVNASCETKDHSFRWCKYWLLVQIIRHKSWCCGMKLILWLHNPKKYLRQNT